MLWGRAALLSPSASSTTIVAGPFWSFEFAILNLFVICDLVLGISHQRAHHLSGPIAAPTRFAICAPASGCMAKPRIFAKPPGIIKFFDHQNLVSAANRCRSEGL
jgi:hypothetical protein